LLQTFSQWSSGSTSATAVSAGVDAALPQLLETTQALSAQAPLAWTGAALVAYQAGAQLYLECARVEQAATTLAAAPLRRQLQLAEMRIRELGDGVYDHAGALLAPYLPAPATTPDVEVIPLPSVPNWKTEQLLPGAPLDRPGGPLLGPAGRASSWTAAVRQTHIPSGATETAAIRSGPSSTLRALSDDFLEAASELAQAPTPAGGSNERTGMRLGLLVDSEATRAAEAARLVTHGAARTELAGAAQALAVIGDDLWDHHFGPRSVGFSPAVLQSGGP
jgi:hypothetical protein